MLYVYNGDDVYSTAVWMTLPRVNRATVSQPAAGQDESNENT